MRLRTAFILVLVLGGALGGYAVGPWVLPPRVRGSLPVAVWCGACALLAGGLGVSLSLLLGRSRTPRAASGAATTAPRARRRIWPRLLLSAGSLVVTLGLCELALRLVVDDDTMNRRQWETTSFHVTEGYELVPNTHSGNVHVNALGYRDRAFSRAKPPGVTRIVAVGDSITFGGGVEAEESFPKRLEALLNARRPGAFEVINGGVPDTGLAEMLRLFERRDLAIHPDVVLVDFYLNDSRPPMGFRSEFIGGDPVVRFVNAHPGLRRSRLFSLAYVYYYNWSIGRAVRNTPISRRNAWTRGFLHGHWRDDPKQLDILIRAAQFDWGAAWLPETWPVVESQLRQFDRLCRAHGVRPVLIAMPSAVQIDATTVRREPQERLAEIAARLGWPYLDLIPGLLDARKDGPLFLDHCHFTRLGHDRVARIIARFLERQGIVAAGARSAGD